MPQYAAEIGWIRRDRHIVSEIGQPLGFGQRLPDQRDILDCRDDARMIDRRVVVTERKARDAGKPFLQGNHHLEPREMHASAAMWALREGRVGDVAAIEIDRHRIGMFGVVEAMERPRCIQANVMPANSEQAIERSEDEILTAIETDPALSSTEKEELRLARRGQGKFRQNVRLIEKACRVTGVTDERLLVASHIKPWSVCADTRERLDGSNGLMLARHIDHLFDNGWMTFDDDGQMRLSTRIDHAEFARLGIGIAVRNIGTFTGAQTVIHSLSPRHVQTLAIATWDCRTTKCALISAGQLLRHVPYSPSFS